MDTNNKVIAAVSALLFAIVLTIVTCAPAFGQVQVRHYRTDLIELEHGVFQVSHILVGGDGTMALVVETGDEEGPKLAVGFAGDRDYTDVQEDGTTAFCFTIADSFSNGEFNSPEVEAVARAKHGGQVCVVWLETDEMFITQGAFGPAASPIMNWCGEEHLMNTTQAPERSYGT